MGKQHRIIEEKVCNWFTKQNPNYKIEKEKQYSISLSNQNKVFFQVDLVVSDKDTGQQIGIECKSINDSNCFRDLCCGIGQAYVYRKRFGLSYLAIECSESWIRDRNELLKRTTLLPNISRELGIGILLVDTEVVCVEEPKPAKPVARTLFITKKKKAN